MLADTTAATKANLNSRMMHNDTCASELPLANDVNSRVNRTVKLKVHLSSAVLTKV
jgi:hypothetical protein